MCSLGFIQLGGGTLIWALQAMSCAHWGKGSTAQTHCQTCQWIGIKPEAFHFVLGSKKIKKGCLTCRGDRGPPRQDHEGLIGGGGDDAAAEQHPGQEVEELPAGPGQGGVGRPGGGGGPHPPMPMGVWRWGSTPPSIQQDSQSALGGGGGGPAGRRRATPGARRGRRRPAGGPGRGRGRARGTGPAWVAGGWGAAAYPRRIWDRSRAFF